MARKDIAEKVEELIGSTVEESGVELVDVEYTREHDWFLRIYIDKEGGVDLQDCQTISEKIGEILDHEDLIAENYLLEVSSPGLDRVIKKDKDIRRYTGRKVDVKLFAAVDGKKMFIAELGGVSEKGDIILITETGKQEWKRTQIAQMRLHFEF